MQVKDQLGNAVQYFSHSVTNYTIISVIDFAVSVYHCCHLGLISDMGLKLDDEESGISYVWFYSLCNVSIGIIDLGASCIVMLPVYTGTVEVKVLIHDFSTEQITALSEHNAAN